MFKSFPVFFLLLAGLCLIVSCGDNTGNSGGKTVSEEGTSKNGYPYTYHIKTGGSAANPGDVVYFHATIRADDSLMYDSRDEVMPYIKIQDPTVPTGRPPNPVEDAVSIMAIGDSMSIGMKMDTVQGLPPELAGVSMMYYDIIVKEIKTAADVEAEAAASKARETEVAAMVASRIADYGAGKLNGDLTTTASGLKYIIHEEGTGPMPTAGEKISVNYYGALAADGTPFDNSFGRGEAFSFGVGQGQVIPGWDEGLLLLKKGSKATFFIPSELAYGPVGAPPVIPADAELTFYVELIQ